MYQASSPFQLFCDTDGSPVTGGKIYIGAANQNPATNPVAIYWDEAGTTPAAQPLGLSGGLIVRYGTPARVFLSVDDYSLSLYNKKGELVYYVPSVTSISTLRGDLAASSGSSMIGFIQRGSGAVASTSERKLRERVSVFDYMTPIQISDAIGITSTGSDHTAAIQAAWDNLADGGILDFPYALKYKITSGLKFWNKGRVRINFNGQYLDCSGFTVLQDALSFKGISQSEMDGIFLIGNKTYVSAGVSFNADSGNSSVHMRIGKIHVSGCNIGVYIGDPNGYQVSDSRFDDIYGADCNIGVYLTGENTLAMDYGRIAAYNNTNYGVLIEQGGGCINSLQVAASGIDLYFGSPGGTNGGKLNRWDITSGYSEEGVNLESFIGSTACVDTNPFIEQIVIKGFRCTPFSSTNVDNFIKWNLNGDLIFRDCSFLHGTQLPGVKIDNNTTYRNPKVVFDNCVAYGGPSTDVQVPLQYITTSSKQRVEMDITYSNAMTFWQNNGSAAEGTMKRGIYTKKRQKFEQALLNVANLKGAWSLADVTSGVCENLVLGGPSLTASALMERRDVWMDDGLFGIFRNSTTSKTVNTSSSVFSNATSYTFGCILRSVTSGTDETPYTSLGGSGGICLGIGYTGGAFARCQVGSYNAQAVPTNPFDPHLLIGRFVSSTSVKLDAINLRTGEVVSAAVGGPLYTDLTWANGVSIRNDLAVRGFPFVYSRAITDSEVSQLLQAALQLTDSWRQ